MLRPDRVVLVACPAAGAARLLIHSEDRDGGAPRRAGIVAKWVGAIVERIAARSARAPLRLRICEYGGREVLALDDAGALVDVALPPGTYQVTAFSGPLRRAYTMVLCQGVSFDLHLRLRSEGA